MTTPTPDPTSSPPGSFPPPPGGPPAPPAWGPPPPGPVAGLLYATFGVRLIALIIDFIVLGIIGGIMAAILGLGFIGWYGVDVFRTGAWPADWFAFTRGSAWIGFVVVEALVSGVYFVASWRSWNATPGQRFMGLQVRDARTGSTLGTEQAILRWAYLTVPVVGSIPGLGLLVFLYQLYLAYTTATDPIRQGFHDRQVGSVVVQRAL